jgi:DnaJ-class molecular chaperone
MKTIFSFTLLGNLLLIGAILCSVGCTENCQNCSGRGRITCVMCSGKGNTSAYDTRVPSRTMECGSCSGVGMKDCSRCKGTGKVATGGN